VSNDIEKRIAVLERENASLKSQVAALRAPASTKVMPLPPSPVKITHPPLAKIVLPTEDEFHRLLEIVLIQYPQLRPREDSAGYSAQFRSAFVRLAHIGRRDKVDPQRGLGFWVDDASEFCRRHQINPPWITGGAFTTAVIAHADIKFVIEDWPHAFVCSLQWGGGGHECRGWWKRALGGALLEPTPPLHPPPLPAPSRIFRQA
jgi:hypothetical protein